MNDFWKGVLTTLFLQWLFNGKSGGCGCSGCLTFLVLGLCLICYLLGLFE